MKGTRSPEAEARMLAMAKEEPREVWLCTSFDLKWALTRAMERYQIRKVMQTIEVVDWRNGYPKWQIEDES